jgi:hypothetical protein
MWRSVMRVSAVWVCALAISGVARADLCTSGLTVTSVNAWDTWEQQLVSQNDYSSTSSNPSANAQDDVNLTVTFKNCNTGYTFTQNGFWYGLTPSGGLDAHQYRIRVSLPAGSGEQRAIGNGRRRARNPAMHLPLL